MEKYWNMFKRVIHILRGAVQWKIIQIRYQINSKKVVIVLVGDNPKLDYYALLHLKDFMNRKYADQAVIFLGDTYYKNFQSRKTLYLMKNKMVRIAVNNDSVRIYKYSTRKIELLYDYYAFYKFSDKIVFTYTDCPKDNQLGKVLKETAVNEEDAVCLGLYRLRTVSRIKERVQRG